MVSACLTAPVQGLAALRANGVEGAPLGQCPQVVVDGGEAHPGSGSPKLSVEVLGAAEIAARGQHLVEGALLTGAPVPLHHPTCYHRVSNDNHCR